MSVAIKFRIRLILLILGMIGIIFTLHYEVTSGPICLYKNQDHSLPHKLYLGFRSKSPIITGKYYTLTHPEYPQLLIKKICGKPGDTISYRDGQVYVNDTPCGIPLTKSPNSGKPMTPVEEGTVPEGYYYVYATHLRSFDSRYIEFGFIEESAIGGRVWPLF